MNRMQLANNAKNKFVKKMKSKKKLSGGEKEMLASFEHIMPDKDGSVILYESNVKNNIALNIMPHEHGLDGIFAMRMKRIF